MTRLWTSIALLLRGALIALAVALTPIAWYLGSPLFINRTISESFPAALALRSALQRHCFRVR